MAESLFSAEQIKIPADLPEILKNYAKFVIKQQPPDILASSAEYFARLAKQRTQANGGKRLSNMQLEAFYNMFASAADRGSVTRKDIDDAAASANISQAQIQDILTLGGWSTDRVPWLKFWAFLCASAAGTLIATVELVCEIIGDNGRISVPFIEEIFSFLAGQDRSVDAIATANVVRALQNLTPKEHNVTALLELIKSEFSGAGSGSNQDSGEYAGDAGSGGHEAAHHGDSYDAHGQDGAASMDDSPAQAEPAHDALMEETDEQA
ncbi:hypothetical protein BC831DRAFT_447535 [Entophlyctis helioformis]|nr:hypothetical protein BC831DRAFT_447535 [Entophlyctis helioformis]